MPRHFLRDDDLASMVWDQAQNRRHARKALLAWPPERAA
jgi:ornithine carbamoyltransferase